MTDFPYENRIWSRDECLSRAELADLQVRRLRELVGRVAHVPFYKEAFGRLRFSAEDIRGLGDLRRLPITTKEDLRQHYPLGFLAAPRERIARIHGSSATAGKAKRVIDHRRERGQI